MSATDSLRVAVNAQSELVRTLKDEKKDFEAELKKLQELKQQLAELDEKANAEKNKLKNFRSDLEDLLTRRFFYIPAFEIYGGVGGLYDYGPPGCALKDSLVDFWRQHFVLCESMLEVSCTCLTPRPVLKASGHVDRFTDFMVRDEKTQDCFRADKLVEEHCEKALGDTKTVLTAEVRGEIQDVLQNAGAYNAKQLGEAIRKYNITSPDTGNQLSDPFPFNLMFETQIGPTGKFVGYLRPETAQGIFVNFRRLLDFNGGRMPFAAAQIGLGFRNEIAPRSGLLRVREFLMGEIEHFVNPEDKSHPRFKEIANLQTQLLGRTDQVGEGTIRTTTFGEAIKNRIIDNETLAYFMARTQLFLTSCGIKSDRLRFRQHKSDEMAHYAADCWDAEILTSYGWVECVGHADRSCYDLKMHAQTSKVDLSAQQVFDKPILVDTAVLSLDNAKVGKTFGKKSQEVMAHLRELGKDDAVSLVDNLKKNGTAQVTLPSGDAVTIAQDMVKDLKIEQKKISTLKFTPSVIEPSFGLGRIIYSILEHCYYLRDDKSSEKRGVLGLPAFLAPQKCAILPLSANPAFDSACSQIAKDLYEHGLSCKVESSSASIGRRYARLDELGVPFGITVDFETEKDKSVTIRERDSMEQVRVPVVDAASLIERLVKRKATWADTKQKYPNVQRAADDE